jgi:hypothetical protein
VPILDNKNQKRDALTQYNRRSQTYCLELVPEAFARCQRSQSTNDGFEEGASLLQEERTTWNADRRVQNGLGPLQMNIHLHIREREREREREMSIAFVP